MVLFGQAQSDKDLLMEILANHEAEASRAMDEEPSSEPCPESTNDEDSVTQADSAPPEPASPLFQDALAAADAAPAPVAQPAPADGPVVNMGGMSKVGTKKASHGVLIRDGACTNCAHCGMKLTDAVSQERGIGPVCSRKGYDEVVPEGVDDMQALILLSEWPELVDHLTENYRPKGIRGLMNGLVRICSLNRRSPVHKACTDAIEALGYVRLAGALRESLAVVRITKSPAFEGCIEIWVRKDVYNPDYGRGLRQIFGQKWDPARKRPVVPVTRKVDDGMGGTREARVLTYVYNRDEDGNRAGKRVPWAPDLPEDQKAMTNRALLWHLLCLHFEGFIVKTEDKGGVYIKPVKA